MNRYLTLFCIPFLFSLPAGAQNLLTAPTPDISAPVAPPPVREIPDDIPAPASSNQPLEITADNSLEWQRNDKTFIARGNAVAKQGDSSVAAQTLTAHYSEKKEGGGMKISNVVAEGDVVIASSEATAHGARADYDLDKGYAVMTGDNLKMVSPDQTVTARDKFEYWVNDGKFTALGVAKVQRGPDTLQADQVSAVMKNNEKGERVLDTLEARGNVIITTPAEMVTGAYGIYRAASNKAELSGGVKILRGPNVLEGERAEVDLTTNTSRIFGSNAPGGRVKGVFYPGSGN